MDYNINVRVNQLENFQQFIDTSKNNLQRILDSIGWTEEEVKDENYLVTCVYDKTHRVAAKNLQEHHRKCSVRRLGYDLEEVQLSEPSDNQKASVIIDDHKKIELFTEARKQRDDFKIGWNGKDPDPKTSERLLTTYSADERLVLYDYAKTVTEGPPVLPEFSITQSQDDDRVLTYEERLERDRDLKRRRIKYKSVHTDHKTHTEVIREVIQNQMELYEEYIKDGSKLRSKDKAEVVESDKEKEDLNGSNDDGRSITSRNSTHSGASLCCRTYKRRRSRGRSNDRSESRTSSKRDDKHNDNYRDSKHTRRFDDKNRIMDRERDTERHRERDRYKRKSSHEDYSSRHKKSHRYS